MQAALAQYLAKEYGGAFTVSPISKTVGTTVVKLVDHNWERMALSVVLLSAGNLYVGFDNTVSSSKGIQLINSGAIMTLDAKTDLALVGHELYAVGDTAGLNVYIIQVNRYQSSQ